MSSLSLWKISTDIENCTVNQLSLDPVVHSLDDISGLTPGGVYTTFRTYDHDKVLGLSKHFSRLEESSSLAGKPIKIDRSILHKVLKTISDQTENVDIRFRITVDLEQTAGTIYISAERLEVPSPQLYQQGGKAYTWKLERNNPRAKLTRQLDTATRIRTHFTGQEFDEIITISEDGSILEGLSSNFFAVVDNSLWTAEEGVLCGTIRDFVLNIASRMDIQIILKGVNISDLARIDEAFITSTSRSILPIVMIDEKIIGSGVPGPVTRQLIANFQKEFLAALERI